MTSELMELAERCEQVSGPSRAVDEAIAPIAGFKMVDEGHPFGRTCYDNTGCAVPIPRYTASLDAAMTLVEYEGGCRRELAWTGNGAECTLVVVPPRNAGPDARTTRYTAEADTPALALCAAALKARARATGGDRGE